MQTRKIPATIVTGFLGRGQTTNAITTLGRDTMEAVGHRMDLTAPVDTGALKRNRSAVRQSGPLTWATGYDLPYAPILEYGGYRGVGPKTVALGGGERVADRGGQRDCAAKRLHVAAVQHHDILRYVHWRLGFFFHLDVSIYRKTAKVNTVFSPTLTVFSSALPWRPDDISYRAS